MILDKLVYIKLNGKMYKYYRDKGYDTHKKKNINIKISDLSIGSHIKINVNCDYCKEQKYIQYRYYVESKKKYDKYSCSDCSKYKNDITNVKRYGVRKPLQNKKIKEKQEKSCMEIFGFKNAFQNEKIKEKIKETSLKKYKVEYPAQSKLIKNKTKNTNLNIYGTISPLQNKEIKKKSDDTKLEKYGTIHPMRNEKVKNKLKQILIKKGYIISSSEFDYYKNNVKNITRQNKKLLFKKWNGYDYYDKEYIKNYLLLHPNDKKYPTIDHKTSILYGFKNQINVEKISDIRNLCITKRHINSSKNSKLSEDFKNKFNKNEKSIGS